MKKIFPVLLFILFSTTLFAQPRIAVDGIVAIIGKEIIMRSDIEAAYQAQLSQMPATDDLEEFRCDVFESLVVEKLMMHQADLDSIYITPEQLEYRINANIAYLTRQVGGDISVIERHFGKSIDEIKAEVRDMTRTQMIVDEVQQSITSNITVTPSEVKNFYNNISYDSLPTVPGQYEFGHIVKTPPVSEEEIAELKARLNGYREKVLRGEQTFKMLARLYSDDPGSANDGGNLGFAERGTFYPEFEAVAFKLKTGEISEIVKTQAGYHIIQMNERRGDRIKVSHILLQPKPSVEEQVIAIEYLDSIRKVAITEKKDFSKAAMEYSDSPDKNSGGWVINPYSGSTKFTKDAMEPVLLSTLDKMIPGEYSQPIVYVNEDGVVSYRIVYLKSKTAPHKPNLVEDYDVIQNAAIEEKKMKAIHKWIRNKVKVTSIKINDNYRTCPFIDEWQIP
ncbi:peptidylprolyl isomerase [Bacteroidales bacterium OttesenSCG-928-B11]|nr:peptidylprolyl isomerase [Bacteroidales bacterium OttesenSCG-928-E04]MDL2312538.1 peptidylprolyl isomerase [Bacteroidales bacterium OttesenSCG-928-B11]MDL2326495.1 peptidylprolyl isomerase [Bacteroidales bacterium OttesenSCG-928-A14]